MAEKQKLLDSGELIIKTDEGIYFLAPHKGATPLLIDAEEGELLFSKATTV
ncbi:hypothetical protein [Shouchella tritolerans]|uniref:hypothetical protein n=1 Tax=Shouchella tritolerans TaxID=2979466 RepID=UPI0021E9367A|nr:hypothetical protein [Shouchella tritolerans]